ncbi:hypothetical protein EWB00_006817, partial [Schistosoma japonicum]
MLTIQFVKQQFTVICKLNLSWKNIIWINHSKIYMFIITLLIGCFIDFALTEKLECNQNTCYSVLS